MTRGWQQRDRHVGWRDGCLERNFRLHGLPIHSGGGGLNGSGSDALSDKRFAVSGPSDPRASIYHFVSEI